MGESLVPRVRFLAEEDLARILVEAKEILAGVGIQVELAEARELLAEAGVRAGEDGRVRFGTELIERALSTVPATIPFFDRAGEEAFDIGGGVPRYCPGSAAIRVLDHGATRMRPSRLEDCETFARLTEQLPAYAFQSTCVVPTDVPAARGDRLRLGVALENCTKPIVTGTFDVASFAKMREMLECVRGGARALAEKPLAIFDCCPTAPLSWSVLTGSALVGCARAGIPAELISMPMTGATAPVTLWGSVVQHTAESLSGVVIHQLAAAGAPLVWGACCSGFDMRHGTSPMGSIESVMLNAAVAQVGRHLGLPTHGYFALSDSKTLDYQAGMESGCGALLAALAGVDVVSGPGILEFVGCQSLEKLVLDHEACRGALRALSGIAPAPAGDTPRVVTDGVVAAQFLNLAHTREHFRRELSRPGVTVDREVESSWHAAGARSAAEVAHAEVLRLLDSGVAPVLASDVAEKLRLAMR